VALSYTKTTTNVCAKHHKYIFCKFSVVLS